MTDAVAVDPVRDAAPRREVIAGAVNALRAQPELHVHLVGPAARIDTMLVEVAADDVRDRIDVHDAPEDIGEHDDPVVAVRARRDASIRRASALVRDGHATRLTTAGPARAAVVAAEFDLGRAPGVRRAGLAAPVPLPAGGTVTLVDAGAHQDAPAQLLVAYAEEVARHHDAANPRVALLAPLGEVRGVAATADRLLAAADLTYVGAVDVAEVLAGGIDVLVADGPLGRTLLDALAGSTGSIADVVGVRGVVRVLRGPLDGVLAQRAVASAPVRVA